MKTISAAALTSALLCPTAVAELDSEIPLGIEAATGFRSSYVYRGFELAETSLEFQLAGEFTLSNETAIGFGLSHLAESSNSFAETSGYFELLHDFNDRWLIGAGLTFRDRRSSLLDGGVDAGIFARYRVNDDWSVRSDLNYDFGNEGLYFATEISWSQPLSEDAYIEWQTGVSLVQDYLGENGFNDLFSRFTLNYQISDQIAISPFVGTSLQLGGGARSDRFFGGLYFQVIF